jgi:hypothetical protein
MTDAITGLRDRRREERLHRIELTKVVRRCRSESAKAYVDVLRIARDRIRLACRVVGRATSGDEQHKDKALK